MVMIKLLNKYFLILLSVLLLLSPKGSYASDANFDGLFSPVDKNYTPYSVEEFDDAKIEALQAKDADAMYAIGMMYMEAVNTKQDFIQAREWFQKASNLGNSDAMIALAYLYTLEKRITKFDKSNMRATKWISEAEKSGNVKAYYQLGLWYENGIVFQKNYKVALQYFRKAAEAKITNAYVKLFLYYYFGRGTEVNLKLAIENLIKVKKEGKTKQSRDFAIYILGELYMDLAFSATDPEIKFKLYELAWSYGKKKAADAIGDMYAEGVGVGKDYVVAEEWYQKAVDSFESVYSMEKLGLMYLKGSGEIERDYKKAFKMFKRAAEIGGVSGAHYLGYMYYYGLGVDKDPGRARTWFSRSKKNAERVNKYGTLDSMQYETDVNKILSR